ncbi:MAG: hypothetical protein JWM96_1137 [Alphaproteobacteria bacterium]|nr:hypothetical protein [Alphaproteobacteria bacterium]
MIDAIKAQLEQRLKHAPPLGYNVTLDFGDDGVLSITKDNIVQDEKIEDADTTLALSPETMNKILAGASDPNMAVLTGKMKVSGKIGVAMKLASYLEK